MNILRTTFRTVPSRLQGASTTIRPAVLLRSSRRYASYQRFPNRGGSSSGGGRGGRSYGPYSTFAPYARLQYIWRNYQSAVLVAGAGGTTFYVINLEQVPITGRRRFNIISPERETSLVSDAAYQQTISQFRGKILPRDHPYTQLVARVVERLLPTAHGLGGGDWQVHVIDEPDQANAFVLPGGKVFVFTGIIPIAQDENGLAAVLGHEIAHNVAHHVGERLSRQVFTMAAAFLVSTVFDVSGQFGNGIADLALTLPNGRTQESEADHIGLLMMAEACYDPRQAPNLWKRMAENEKKRGGAPPQFLSTHPSSGTRGQAMEKWMPEAMGKYEQSECSITARGMNDFRKIADIGRRMPGNMSILTGTGGGRSRQDDDWPF